MRKNTGSEKGLKTKQKSAKIIASPRENRLNLKKKYFFRANCSCVTKLFQFQAIVAVAVFCCQLVQANYTEQDNTRKCYL